MAKYYEPADDDRRLSETILSVLAKKNAGEYKVERDVFIEEYDKDRIAEKVYRLFEELI